MNQATVFDALGIDTSFKPSAATCVDGYKIGHAALYPEGVEFTYGNGTPRGDRLFVGTKSCSRFYDNKVVWVGIQGVMREVHGLWQRTFFDVPKEKAIARYSRRMKAYLGNGDANLKYLSDLHDGGYLPVTVLSIDEGERLDMNVPGYVIYAFGKHFWIMNYLETIMSNLLWKIVCNATIAYEYRRLLEHFADATGVHKDFVAVQGHDFSMRGMSGIVDAASSGFGHLASFIGTDTLPAIDYAEDMYGADVEKEVVAVSVVATEHAVATSNILYEVEQLMKLAASNGWKADDDWYRRKGEENFIKRVITEVHPTGVVSLVSDSFDFWTVIDTIIPALKAEILARTPDGSGLAKVVIRPDSGDPVEVICGKRVYPMADVEAVLRRHFSDDGMVITDNSEAQAISEKIRHLPFYSAVLGGLLINGSSFLASDESGQLLRGVVQGDTSIIFTSIDDQPLTAEEKGAVQCLWETFGGTITDKGYKTLHERIGLIYGDSITVARTEQIMIRLMEKGFSSANVILGIGSYTYQYNTRDTFAFAVKATACVVKGEFIELYKAPKTEGDTNKKSAKGFLKVVKEDGKFKLLQQQNISIDRLKEDSGELKPVYENGVFLNPVVLSTIRQRLLG